MPCATAPGATGDGAGNATGTKVADVLLFLPPPPCCCRQRNTRLAATPALRAAADTDRSAASARIACFSPDVHFRCVSATIIKRFSSSYPDIGTAPGLSTSDHPHRPYDFSPIHVIKQGGQNPTVTLGLFIITLISAPARFRFNAIHFAKRLPATKISARNPKENPPRNTHAAGLEHIEDRLAIWGLGLGWRDNRFNASSVDRFLSTQL
jgi:hypothetical protein